MDGKGHVNHNRIECDMGLFKVDFYRSFFVGFALGAVAVVASLGINVADSVVGSVAPAVQAAAETR